MKKAIILIVFLLISGAVFGQDYTFQGLPWGSTKEQVIAKLGEPNSVWNSKSSSSYVNISLTYLANINGYNTKLDINFHDSKMSYAFYTINSPPFRDLNENQLKIALLSLLKQLTEKYGAFHEVFTDNEDSNIQYWVWHFNNFHIYISSIALNTFEIGYRSTVSWKILEEELKYMNRLPNRDL